MFLLGQTKFPCRLHTGRYFWDTLFSDIELLCLLLIKKDDANDFKGNKFCLSISSVVTHSTWCDLLWWHFLSLLLTSSISVCTQHLARGSIIPEGHLALVFLFFTFNFFSELPSVSQSWIDLMLSLFKACFVALLGLVFSLAKRTLSPTGCLIYSPLKYINSLLYKLLITTQVWIQFSLIINPQNI